jgi:uncharacterized protein (TIGR03382 family)
MKITAALLIVLALIVGIAPQFTACPVGTMVMKCHWSAQAEVASAAPLLALGGVLLFSRRRESQRFLAIMGVVLGAMVALIPTSLIGVCPNGMMHCNTTMRPILVLAGILVAGVSAAVWVLAGRTAEPVG